MTTDPNSPKVLATVRTDIEAALIVNHLADRGIKAYVSGAGSATGWPEAPGDVQIVVRQIDLAQATELLDLVRNTDQEEGPDAMEEQDPN